MTRNNELFWNHAIDNENYELAEAIARSDAGETTDTAPVAPVSTAGSDVEIMRTYEYWELPLPGLPTQGTP